MCVVTSTALGDESGGVCSLDDATGSGESGRVSIAGSGGHAGYVHGCGECFV